MNLQASELTNTLATTGYRSQSQPMGVDIGNGQLKLVASSGESLTESYVYYLSERSTDTVKGYVEYLDGDRADLKGKQWIGGINAYYNGLSSIYRVTDSKEGKPELGLQIFLSALSELPYRDVWNLAIAVSVHDSKTLGSALKRALEGSHTVRIRHKQSELNIKVVAGLEEGTGAVITYQKQADTTNAILYDLGNGTLIVSSFNGLKMTDRKYSQDGGVEKLFDQIATHDAVRTELKKEGDRHLIRKGVETQTFGYGTQYPDWNFESVYREELPKWVNNVLAPTVRPWDDRRASATALIAIGGGAELPGIASLLSKKNIKVLGDPLWANARGLYTLATRKVASLEVK
jgi:hypothetical protein